MGDNASQGGSRAQLSHDDFWYYDRLPPTARQALANALFDWSAGYYYNNWNRGKAGFKTGADVARQVARADNMTQRKLP